MDLEGIPEQRAIPARNWPQQGKCQVPVEKVSFLKKRRKMGDRKCLGDPRKSLIGHPGAILFLAFSFGRLFQQAPKFSTFDR
jgi:hypothetical protein